MDFEPVFVFAVTSSSKHSDRETFGGIGEISPFPPFDRMKHFSVNGSAGGVLVVHDVHGDFHSRFDKNTKWF